MLVLIVFPPPAAVADIILEPPLVPEDDKLFCPVLDVALIVVPPPVPVAVI